MKKPLKAALVAATALCACPTGAAEFYTSPEHQGGLIMYGSVEQADDQKFDNVLEQRRNQGLVTEWLSLESAGGRLYAASNIAQMVRSNGIKTVVGASDSVGICASACMLIYAAGVERHAWEGARLGVHNANTGIAKPDGAPDDDGKGTVMLATEMANYGTPASVIAKLVITPADSMAWLTNDDVAGWVIIPNNPELSYRPSNPGQLTCQGQKGTYPVGLFTNGMVVNGKHYPITEQHRNSNTGAWVVTGPTKYGRYSAVFGGPNPRMEYWNGEEKVTDRCFVG
jgi:hypothetical protein